MAHESEAYIITIDPQTGVTSALLVKSTNGKLATLDNLKVRTDRIYSSSMIVTLDGRILKNRHGKVSE